LLLAWQQTGQDDTLARTRYEEAKSVAKKALRKDLKESWLRHLEKGGQFRQRGEMGKLWAWAKRMTGDGKLDGSRSRVQPILGRQDRELKTEPDQIVKEWTSHYGKLASEEQGHSKDPAWWRQHRFLMEEKDALTSLDEDVTWNEVRTCLRNMSVGKAAGGDNIPPEWYKAALGGDSMRGGSSPSGMEGSNTLTPVTPMGKALLKLVNQIWGTSYVPKQWRSAMVVSIPKKGDLREMDNYRGISLICVGLKVLSTVIARRISSTAEDEGLLCRSQAGFRSLEECMGQVVALSEIAQRRQLNGERTYACFIDFRKAYDMVPHEALLHKLRLLGIRDGRCYKFIEAVYSSTYMTARVGADLVTPEIQLRRGLRQGCPMSPILFDLFINDILKGCAEDGVSVPGLTEGEKCEGLLFADDLVLVAPNVESLKRNMARVERWAEDWEMEFGVAKCGVMCIGGKDDPDLVAGDWRLQGQVVPRVDQYCYLGWIITEDPGEAGQKVGIKARVEKGRKALMGQAAFFRSQSIPMYYKLMMLRGVIIPTLTYGGELTGMCRERVKSLQTVVDLAIKWACGVRLTTRAVSMVTLWRELGIPPMAARLASLRTRAYLKYASLSTWVSILMTHKACFRKATWMSGSQKWLKAHKYLQNGGCVQETNHLVSRVLEGEWTKMDNVSHSEILRQYHDMGYSETIEYLSKLGTQNPRIQVGLQWVLKMRTGTFWTMDRLNRLGLVEGGKPCLCHGTPGGERQGNPTETLEHLLVECTLWETARAQKLESWIERVRCFPIEGSTPSEAVRPRVLAMARKDIAILLGGRIVGPLSPQIEDRLAPIKATAEFLTEIASERTKSLRRLRGASSETTPRAEARTGMATLTTMGEAGVEAKGVLVSRNLTHPGLTS
jgi:hypothetical protein